MGLGTLTLYGNTDGVAREGPHRQGPYIVEHWKYVDTDATRGATDIITCKGITKVAFARGCSNETFATDPFTIDNTVFPPTVKVNYIGGAGESGEVDIFGY